MALNGNPFPPCGKRNGDPQKNLGGEWTPFSTQTFRRALPENPVPKGNPTPKPKED